MHRNTIAVDLDCWKEALTFRLIGLGKTRQRR